MHLMSFIKTKGHQKVFPEIFGSVTINTDVHNLGLISKSIFHLQETGLGNESYEGQCKKAALLRGFRDIQVFDCCLMGVIIFAFLEG